MSAFLFAVLALDCFSFVQPDHPPRDEISLKIEVVQAFWGG
jgi:hypothetical protein